MTEKIKTEAEARITLEPFRWRSSSNYGGQDLSDYFCVLGRTRDSGLLETSNWEVGQTEFKEFDTGWEVFGFNHWGVGWIDELMVHEDAPEAVLILAANIRGQLEAYPILDEEDHSRREYEAAVENITEAYSSLKRLDVYDGTLSTRADVKVIEQLVTWFCENRPDGMSSSDDSGFYPSDEELTEALTAIGS